MDFYDHNKIIELGLFKKIANCKYLFMILKSWEYLLVKAAKYRIVLKLMAFDFKLFKVVTDFLLKSATVL